MVAPSGVNAGLMSDASIRRDGGKRQSSLAIHANLRMLSMFFDWPHADLIQPPPGNGRRRYTHFGGVPDSILGSRAPLPLEDERPS